MIEETSAGVVIYRKEKNDTKYLLLNYPAGHWDFVKGKMEKNEKPIQTAIRETKEETGLSDLNFIEGFEEKIDYHFQHEGRLIHKQVLFYLAESKTRKVTLSYEHLDYAWLDFEQSLKRITYCNAKKILEKANAFLSKS